MSTPDNPYGQPSTPDSSDASSPYTTGSGAAQGQYGQGQYGQQPYGGYGQQSFQGQNQQFNNQYGQQPYGAYQQPYMQPAVGQKSKIAAGLLGIFLGFLGIHNFYLGKTKIAVIQLLITVLSFGALAWATAIWGLVEGILILVSKPGDAWHRDAKGFELSD